MCGDLRNRIEICDVQSRVGKVDTDRHEVECGVYDEGGIPLTLQHVFIIYLLHHLSCNSLRIFKLTALKTCICMSLTLPLSEAVSLTVSITHTTSASLVDFQLESPPFLLSPSSFL